MKKKLSNENPTYETIKKIRGNWGQISPCTKVIPNKKKNPKIKHKKKELEQE